MDTISTTVTAVHVHTMDNLAGEGGANTDSIQNIGQREFLLQVMKKWIVLRAYPASLLTES